MVQRNSICPFGILHICGAVGANRNLVYYFFFVVSLSCCHGTVRKLLIDSAAATDIRVKKKYYHSYSLSCVFKNTMSRHNRQSDVDNNNARQQLFTIVVHMVTSARRHNNNFFIEHAKQRRIKNKSFTDKTCAAAVVLIATISHFACSPKRGDGRATRLTTALVYEADGLNIRPTPTSLWRCPCPWIGAAAAYHIIQ